MDMVLLLARLLLAAVFATAGFAKLVDRAGTRQAMRNFGVPGVLAAPFGLLLPLTELALAVALIPTDWAWWGAVGALLLLLLFIGGIGVNLARGRRPDCHCFGQIASAPIGASTLLRNAALALVAGFIIWQGRNDPGPSAVAWLSDLTALERIVLGGGVILLGLLALEAWVLVQLLGQNGRVLARLDTIDAAVRAGPPSVVAAEPIATQPAAGLPVGATAPGFSLTGLYSETLTLEALRATGKPLLLTFMDPNCGPCNALLPDVGRWQRELTTATLAIISRGTAEENRAKSVEHGLTHILLQQDREVEQSYLAYGTPSAVVVRPDGTVGSPLAEGSEQIRALVARLIAGGPDAATPTLTVLPPAAVASNGHGDGPCPHCGRHHAGADVVSAEPAGLPVGTPAPVLKLPNLHGRPVDLLDFRGRRTLVLFWNPDCGFCQQMLPDLKAWEADPPESAPKLLVVSTGTADANHAQGLRSQVVLDEGFAAGTAFGAGGTPSAVLVDEEGTIASPLAVGAHAVLALARNEEVPPAIGGNNGPVPPALQIGDPAPALTLPDLDGAMVDLADFRGSPMLVLFWNPDCGYCREMLPDLQRWEATRPPDAPALLVVSTGSVESNRALGLRSPVLLDQSFAAGTAFGANGTPMAVLVHADGRITSDVAAGAEAVLALASGGAAQQSR